MLSSFRSSLSALALLVCFGPALADEKAIRRNLTERMPRLPKIDEISKAAVPGLYELRVGTDIYYADEQSDHLFAGQLLDTRNGANLTAIDFAQLPLKDAIVWRIQLVNATDSLNISAGVLKPSVLRGLSFNCLAIALSCSWE